MGYNVKGYSPLKKLLAPPLENFWIHLSFGGTPGRRDLVGSVAIESLMTMQNCLSSSSLAFKLSVPPRLLCRIYCVCFLSFPRR